MDYRLALMTGTDIPVPECQLTIHQPKIQEISFIGEQDFFVGAQCLTINKSMFVQDKTVLQEVNNFHIFMMIMQEKQAKEQKIAVQRVLTLLFPKYKVLLTPNTLLFQKENESIIVDESNFEQLQDVFRLVFCAKNGPMDQQAYNPAGAKAQEIAKKLMRGRERIAAEKGSNTASAFSQYISMLSVGLHLTVQSLIELTMFQLYDLVERYMLWINWDIDIRSRLAGGKPDHEPDNWMKNLH